MAYNMGRGIIPANRAFQFEAHNLDQEFGKVLNSYVENLGISKFSDELKLLLKLYVSSNYIKGKTTIGMKTFNMELKDLERGEIKSYKLILLAASNLIIPYISKRFTTLETQINETLIDRLKLSWLTFENLTAIIKILNLFNFLHFLRNGTFLTLQERVLGVVPVIEDQNYDFSISINKAQMEYMSRDIIWKAIAESITLMLPYVNTTKLKNQALRLTGWMPSSLEQHTRLSDVIAKKSEILKCGICDKQPFNPFIIGCKHVFCYYCVQSKYLVDQTDGYVCPSCNYRTQDLSQLQRYRLHLKSSNTE